MFDGLIPEFTTDANALLVNNIKTALAFISLGTTVAATSLIGYRIYASDTDSRQFKERKRRIMVTMIESSSIYSLVLFLYALTLCIPQFSSVFSPMLEVVYYTSTFLFIVAVSSTFAISDIYGAHKRY